MKLFQTAQQNFVYFGIGPYDPNRKNQYNKLIFLYIFLTILCFILSGTFVIVEANTFEEYTEGIYILSAAILSPMATASIALKLRTLFELIKRGEQIFDASKFKRTSIFFHSKLWNFVALSVTEILYRNDRFGFKRSLRGSCRRSGKMV